MDGMFSVVLHKKPFQLQSLLNIRALQFNLKKIYVPFCIQIYLSRSVTNNEANDLIKRIDY